MKHIGIFVYVTEAQGMKKSLSLAIYSLLKNTSIIKKFYMFFILLLGFSFYSLADNPTVLSVPSDDFPNISDTVDYINTQGPGDNGLVFEIAGDNVFTEPHLTISTSGSLSAPILSAWSFISSEQALGVNRFHQNAFKIYPIRQLTDSRLSGKDELNCI